MDGHFSLLAWEGSYIFFFFLCFFLSFFLSLDFFLSFSVSAGSPSSGRDVAQPSLPTPLKTLFFFNPVLVSVSVFMAHSTVFHSTNPPDNSPLSRSVLLVLYTVLLVLSIFISL